MENILGFYKIFDTPINFRSLSEEEFDSLLWEMHRIDFTIIFRYRYYHEDDFIYSLEHLYYDFSYNCWTWDNDWDEGQDVELLGIISNCDINADELYEYLKSQPQRVENLEEEMKRQAIERMIQNEETKI